MNNKLDEKLIKRYCELYRYGYRHFEDVVVITTGVDEWRLTYKEKQDKILVEHINKAGNSSGKMQYHAQKYADDIHYIFKNIIKPHETFDNVYNKAFKIKQLLQEYA